MAGLTVTGVTAYQAVTVQLVKDGAVSPAYAPVIAGRPVLVRAFVAPAPTFMGAVQGCLTVTSGAGIATHVVTTSITGPSAEGSLATTLNFELPASEITPGATVSLDIGGQQVTATDLHVQAGIQLELVLVPFEYQADGSNRLPDVDPVTLEKYRSQWAALLPVRDIAMEVHAKVPVSQVLGPTGTNWQNALDMLAVLRASEAAGTHKHYVGLVAPAVDFKTFCAQGCQTGLVSVPKSPADEAARATIGVAFPGAADPTQFYWSFSRLFGRQGLPACGGQPPFDLTYPYPDGTIGLYGYNQVTKKLVPPLAHDAVTFCNPPIWTSDHNFKGMFGWLGALGP